jgi:hypothetical protein
MRLSSTCCTAWLVYHDDGGVRACWMGLWAHGQRSTATLVVHSAPPVNGGVESEHDAVVVLSCRAQPPAAAALCSSCGVQHRRRWRLIIMASVYERRSKHHPAQRATLPF